MSLTWLTLLDLQITSTSNPSKPYTLHLTQTPDPTHSMPLKAYCSCPAWAFNLHKTSLARAKMKEKGQDPGSEATIQIVSHSHELPHLLRHLLD
jgi:hypothetical protein